MASRASADRGVRADADRIATNCARSRSEGRIGCASALRRFGVWSGIDDALHLHVPRTASRLAPAPDARSSLRTPACGIRRCRQSRRRDRIVRLASDAAPRVHWARDTLAMDGPRLDRLASGGARDGRVRCMDAEHASAAIDSALHERVLTRREVDEILASQPERSAALVDRLHRAGRSRGSRACSSGGRPLPASTIESQVDLAGLRPVRRRHRRMRALRDRRPHLPFRVRSSSSPTGTAR